MVSELARVFCQPGLPGGSGCGETPCLGLQPYPWRVSEDSAGLVFRKMLLCIVRESLQIPSVTVTGRPGPALHPTAEGEHQGKANISPVAPELDMCYQNRLSLGSLESVCEAGHSRTEGAV